MIILHNSNGTIRLLKSHNFPLGFHGEANFIQKNILNQTNCDLCIISYILNVCMYNLNLEFFCLRRLGQLKLILNGCGECQRVAIYSYNSQTFWSQDSILKNIEDPQYFLFLKVKYITIFWGQKLKQKILKHLSIYFKMIII